ncbi:hypothetical protein SEPCBS119000_005057 [Sporothrix epigloea]|uniref:Peptidase S54 rhomboid domain-containing protein n=1 Tax=Sporothrix epigloea TaxID=1892477 RepID=A0ABP0DVH8_9PEZI
MNTFQRLPPVRLFRPALWCVTAVGTIYTVCGLVDARQRTARIDEMARRRREAYYGLPTWPPSPSSSSPPPSSSYASAFANLPGPTKLMGSLVATNVGVFAMERLLPQTSVLFSHVPAGAAAGGLNTNLTLLTSAFGHVGVPHLLLNMYGLVQFLPPVANSRTFDGSASHLAAFYLSAGILSSYAFQVASAWPRPMDRMIPARGASGAVMAIVGAFGMAYPDRQLGVILIPFSLPASQFLLGLAAFETYGLFVGFKRLPLAHAAHLAGLALGSAYVYWDGQRHIWAPVQRWTFSGYNKLAQAFRKQGK